MAGLLESFGRALDAHGDATSPERRNALAAALQEGLPGPRAERWKYTPLRALERRTFAPPARGELDPAVVADIPAPRIVLVDGMFDASASDLSGLDAHMHVARASGEAAALSAHAFRRNEEFFARINTALASEGVLVEVTPGATVATPLHVVHVATAAGGDHAVHLRHRIRIGAGARASVAEHWRAQADHAHLANVVMLVELADGARLEHARVQREAPRATLLARTDATIAAGAHYRRVDLELGGGLSRHELDIALAGEGASAHADGALLATARRQLDTRLGVMHSARGTHCSLTWRGLAAGRARVAFHGGILIEKGADGSEAMLSNKNLLLSADAEVNAQPVLEIHADEVKAAHGATVGRLDPTALFYLRSRGVPEAQARALLTAAFCHEAIDAPMLQDMLRRELDDALAREALA